MLLLITTGKTHGEGRNFEEAVRFPHDKIIQEENKSLLKKGKKGS